MAVDISKYDRWDEEPFAGCENPEVPYAKWVLSKIPRPINVIDIGCGTGVHTKWFNDQGIFCWGITINDDEIKKRVHENVIFGSMSSIPFPNSWFDLVFCLGTLEHTYFPYVAISEFSRVLKLGGYLFLDMPGMENFHVINNEYWYHKSILFPIQVRDLMLKTNFVLVDGNWEEDLIRNPADSTVVEYHAKTVAIYLAKKVKNV